MEKFNFQMFIKGEKIADFVLGEPDAKNLALSLDMAWPAHSAVKTLGIFRIIYVSTVLS